MSEEKSLVELMDEATRVILGKIVDPDSSIPDADKVRMLGAANDWMVARIKAAPPPKTESKFAILKGKLAGPERRGAKGRGTPAEADEG